MAGLTQTDLPELPLVSRGKVRDIYDLGDRLLLVATDRISAFDVVLPQPVPDKGKVLHQISLYWFDRMKEVIPNHIVAGRVADFPPELQTRADQLAGRSAIVRKAEMLPIECVARGYLSGSGWKEYQSTGSVCGIALPPGLQESGRLPEPIFTPATKAATGHDINIPFDEAADLVGHDTANRLRDLTLAIYGRAADEALAKGIMIADTKFEFGVIDGEIVVCDEMLTPDSSRFWPADQYRPGGAQPSFDKQFVRDWLESVHWNKQPPAPDLPEDVIEGTRRRYLEALIILSGHGLTE